MVSSHSPHGGIVQLRRRGARTSRSWPADGGLDIAALLATGFRPVPFALFLFKVHSRCNLACDYCYVYEHADQSWRRRPKQMPEAVMHAALHRIRDHAVKHGLAEVQIGLHGGEPLLVEDRRLCSFLAQARAVLEPIAKVSFCMQTNGTLLTTEVLEVLRRQCVKVGLSLDGNIVANDRHRRDARGQSSYHAARRGLDLLLTDYRSSFGAVLCTIDCDTPALDVYEHFTALGVPALDFLLPHGNWQNPPPGKQVAGATPYADWLLPVFDRWYETSPKRVSIRLFEEIIHLVLGGRGGFEALGLAPVNLVVIETDGSYEGVDTLKSTYEGAAHTGMSVFDAAFDDLLLHPMFVARQIGVEALCEECRGCSRREVCGGGYFPHRLHAEQGFLSPSVYCADLKKLIDHIQGRVQADLARVTHGVAP